MITKGQCEIKRKLYFLVDYTLKALWMGLDIELTPEQLPIKCKIAKLFLL